MKKTLIALAIASAVSAPAFAATSNVDVYGKLHLSVNFLNDQEETSNNTQISSNASRIGFKGTEDLGGGLKAIWQIETGVNLDEQNGTWANRNSYVGLAGGFGTVLVGNHDTPFKLVGRAVDLFGDTIADSRNVLGGSNTAIPGFAAGDLAASSDMRADNVIAYISPDMSGFGFAVAYSTDPVSSATVAPDVQDSDVWSLNATYTNGPLYLGGAYSDGDGLENLLGWDDNWRLAAGYTFGNFKVVGQYDSYSDASSFGEDYDAWMVGGAYTMGAAVFKANYMSGEIDGVDADIEQWTIGADYNLSKRTSVYALYMDGQNIMPGFGAGSSDVNVPGDWTLVGGANEDISAIAVGVTHSF